MTGKKRSRGPGPGFFRKVRNMKATVHDVENFRNRRHVFTDRFDAGETLGEMMKPAYGNAEGCLILAIPAGGVPVGIRLREILGLPLDLLIVRKLKIPGNPEAGFGAMTLDGSTFLNRQLLAALRLGPPEIEAEKRRVATDLKKRNAFLRKGRPFPDLAGKKIILVDDGLASGFTMLAAVDGVRKAKAAEVVVAVPTAPRSSIDRILPEVDGVYCPNIRTGPYFAVAEAYETWYDLSEREVSDLLS